MHTHNRDLDDLEVLSQILPGRNGAGRFGGHVSPITGFSALLSTHEVEPRLDRAIDAGIAAAEPATRYLFASGDGAHHMSASDASDQATVPHAESLSANWAQSS